MDVKAELVSEIANSSSSSSAMPIKTEASSSSSVQPIEVPAPAVVKQEQQVRGSTTRDLKRARQPPTSSGKRKNDKTTVISKTKRVKSEATSTAAASGAALSSSSSSAPPPETCSRCSSTLDHTGEPKVLTCACCNVLLAESAFSRSQAHKDRVIKRCMRCVEAGGAPILKVIEQEPAFSGTKPDPVQRNAERLKRAEDNLLLKTARVVPRITRRQAAALEKQRKPMTEDEEIEFAARMRELVYGRRAYFTQVASKSKTLMTKRELGDLDATRGRLNRLEKALVVQNQQLFDELYAVIK